MRFISVWYYAKMGVVYLRAEHYRGAFLITHTLGMIELRAALHFEVWRSRTKVDASFLSV